MNPERLLAHYEQIADAPDALARLRRFTLNLAVRGKLVQQDATEEPAYELMKRITKEKARLVKEGQIRKEKILPELQIDDALFELPLGWSWVRLGSVTIVVQGFAFSSGDFATDPSVGLPLIKIGDIGGDAPETFIKGDPDPAYLVKPGDILLGLSGSIKCSIWKGPEALLNQRIARIAPPSTDLDAVWLLFAVNACIDKWKEETSKLTVQNIKAAQLYEAVIPLPPLAEQRRIVAKVDELMGLFDRLEAARADREATRDRLAAASLARLNAPDPETFRADARFALDALPALTTRSDQIKALRQTILNLAVRGKLVPQDAKDEPADGEILAVEQRKAKLGLKKPRRVEQIEESEKWCRTPQGWQWTRWDQITDWITYGFTRPMHHADNGVPIVTGKNVNEGRIIFETASLTPQASFEALNEKDKPQPGDILITKDGSIGRTAIVEERHLPFCINQSVAVMWLRSCHFDRSFLKLMLDAPQTQEVLLEKTAGVAIKHISITDLGKMVFPLPPLAEQRRIVARVDALMRLCDQLEAGLTATAATRRRLLDALLAEALAPVENVKLEAAE